MILDLSKNKSCLYTFIGVKFYCGLNLDPVFGVGKQSHTKCTHTKDIADYRMCECSIGSNCTDKQADSGVHSLNFTCMINKKNRKPLMHVKRRLNFCHTIPNLKYLAEEELQKKIFLTSIFSISYNVFYH